MALRAVSYTHLETIMGVGQLARDGMKETDDEIIKLMIQN